jgi:ketosteroid isomerase-like protein
VPEQNKAMVRRLVEAINVGEEGAAVQELFAPRVGLRVTRLFADFRSAFPDWHEEIVDLVAEGDTVAGRFRCSGTHRGEFLGEAPTGKRMDVEEVFFLRVEDGKFVDFWGLEDSLGRMRQLGLLPSPKRSEKGDAAQPS